MKFMLDTANIKDIKKYNDIFPIIGITSNPSIIKKEGKIDFSSAVWSTNKLNRVFHSTVSSILSDVDFVAETDKEILFVEYKNVNSDLEVS